MKESTENEKERFESLSDIYQMEDDDEDIPEEDEDNINDLEMNDEYQDRSCIIKCCCYLCCCHSSAKSKKFYQKSWRNYLVKEGNDSSDAPFKILTNLFSNKDGSIEALESIRLNPNLVSANKLRNDLEFYIPQLCTFLLFGEMKAIEEFFVFLCKVCSASFFFAHRVHWFLSAMINASQTKKEDIINILKMINTLFRSENAKRKNKISKFYIANSNPFIKYIKTHNLYFLYDNNSIKNQENRLEDIDYNLLDGYQQEIYNKYKNSREKIKNFSEKEYNLAKEKEEEKINNKNNKNPSKNDENTEERYGRDNEKFKANDFFIDLSYFKLLNEDITYEEELEEEKEVIKTNQANQEDNNTFINIKKSPLDINFISYHSSINFIDHLCDISNELPKYPVEEQMLYLYEQLFEINKKLPCNVYLPFLAESTRNYLICHIPLEGVKIFRTKTRCPIMLTFEMIRIDEINKDIKKDEEFGTTINLSRSRSISSMNSSMTIENAKKDLLKDKIRAGYKENNYENVDYNLSKPFSLQTLQSIDKISRFTLFNNPVNITKLKEKNEMNLIFINNGEEMDKNQTNDRKSYCSESSIDSFTQENTSNEKFQKIIVKFRNSLIKTEDVPPLIESKTIKMKSSDDYSINSKNQKRFTLTSNRTGSTSSKEQQDAIFENENERCYTEANPKRISKNINANDLKNIFGESFKQKERKCKKNSLFGNLDSHKIFRCIIKTHEDLRQEQFATQLINEFFQIFRLENTGCWLNTYEIISTGNNAGLVEMVNDSISLDQLKQKIQQASLKDFYLFNFGNGDANSYSYKRAMNNYIASLAGYSLVCYFLSIKDRHNGNILIDSEGHIIHIDFGFLLSNAPGKGLKFENAPFKLSNDMLDCLGGVNGKYFANFRKLLHKGFMAVNKHREKISILVEMMWCGHGKQLDCFEKGQEAIDQLKIRLNPRPNMKVSEMKLFVDNLISQSVDNWRTKWYDIFQYHVQGIFY